MKIIGAMLGLWLAAGPAGAAQAPLRVLFIGNSYTYVHDVPGLVQAFSQSGSRPLIVEMHAQPAWSLKDHLKDRRRLRALLDEPWDWVVLQQGASSRPDSRLALVENTREIVRMLRRAQASRRREALGLISNSDGPQSAAMRRVGRAADAMQGVTRVAMYSTWPPLPMAADSYDAEDSYREAAKAVHACMLPVAAAWRTALQAGGAPTLYSEDQLHATRAGAVLAALVIAPSLSGDAKPPPVAIPAGASEEEIARLRRLENAAAAALAAEPLRC